MGGRESVGGRAGGGETCTILLDVRPLKDPNGGELTPDETREGAERLHGMLLKGPPDNEERTPRTEYMESLWVPHKHEVPKSTLSRLVTKDSLKMVPDKDTDELRTKASIKGEFCCTAHPVSTSDTTVALCPVRCTAAGAVSYRLAVG